MKEKVKTIVILFILAILFFAFVPATKVLATSYENIDLNALNEIRDNQELLDTVINVRISYESDMSLVNILSKCNNLGELRIEKATIDDLEFINDIKPNNGFVLILSMGYYNMEGISNPFVKQFCILSSYITNFSKGMDVENVERIDISFISGYEDIDYSKYPNLKDLSFWGIAIDDYEVFFEQLVSLNSLENLSLRNCNIMDEDTKYLKELTSIKLLNLEDCHISDIKFMKDMQQLTCINLPLNVEDLNVVREMPNLESVYWTGYEQLALTDELVKYLDDNNINHNKYDKNLKNTLLNMIDEMNIDENMTVKEKVETVIDYTSNFVISHDNFYDETYSNNSLLYIVHYKIGVCSNYSYLQHALLKLIGVETWNIGGLIPVYMSELNGGFYLDEIKYELAGHAWLMVQDENGIWYGWDPVQIDQGMNPPWDSTWGKKYNFWKNPYEDDTYTLDDYQDGKYDSFNYNFAKRRIVTTKIGYEDYLNECKIIFNSNNENVIQSKQRVYKNIDNKLNKNLFTRDGYTFKAWNTKADGTGISYQDEEIIKINANTTLYAQWEPNKYTIKFFAGSGNGTMEDVTVTAGEYTLPECEFTGTNLGLEFDNWYIPNIGMFMEPGAKITVNNNMELYAQWKEKTTFTVTFDTVGGSSVEKQTINRWNNAVEPKEPTKEGYKFIGWYEDSTYQFRFSFYKPITADTTLYAKWVKNENLIKNISINVEIPTVGDEVTIEKFDEYFWNWDTQKPQMKITIPNEANYHLFDFDGECNYMNWITSLEYEFEPEPFIGTFEYNTDYYARIFIETDSEYFLSDDVEVIVNGKNVDKIFYIYDNYIELGVKLTTSPEKIVYKIIEGENQTYIVEEEKDFIVKANGEISKFDGLKVDDKILEPSNYIVVSGSTVVTLKSEYLNTLEEGKHTLTFLYSDGEISTDFTIVKEEIKDDTNILPDNDKNDTDTDTSVDTEIKEETTDRTDKNTTSSSPKTGDNIILWVVLILVSTIGILGTCKYIKKRD